MYYLWACSGLLWRSEFTVHRMIPFHYATLNREGDEGAGVLRGQTGNTLRRTLYIKKPWPIWYHSHNGRPGSCCWYVLNQAPIHINDVNWMHCTAKEKCFMARLALWSWYWYWSFAKCYRRLQWSHLVMVYGEILILLTLLYTWYTCSVYQPVTSC